LTKKVAKISTSIIQVTNPITGARSQAPFVLPMKHSENPGLGVVNTKTCILVKMGMILAFRVEFVLTLGLMVFP
jgi:hypothetical protein